ncbi:hypothetical protein H4R33_003179 [Dimargaris cristalligena]|nr:hypothetical protein H4R33_003179 [Dimargaris cristalligena]
MSVQVVERNQQVDKVVLKHVSGATCEVRTLGATVTSWVVQDRERLFLSQKAVLNGTKAIRGGIPLVFPQFGQGPLMPGQHGFARNLVWEYQGVTRADPEEVMVCFRLRDSAATRASGWAHAFKLSYLVTLTATTLGTHLAVTNIDKTAFRFTPLLHTYFATPDIKEVKIRGLQGLNYTDKTADNAVVYEDRAALTFDGEVDRIYHGTPDQLLVVVSPPLDVIEVKSINFRDTVVWNPWIEKAQAMSDFADDEYRHMFCVESGSVHEAVSLSPSQTWEAGQVLVIKE